MNNQAVIGKGQVCLGGTLKSESRPFGFKILIPGETDIIVYGTFAVPSKITRMSVFSGDRPHTTCAV